MTNTDVLLFGVFLVIVVGLFKWGYDKAKERKDVVPKVPKGERPNREE